ncbi:MAG: peptidoglycan DD-metalloendopeptidase family protein [Nitrospirae bacterium]|nr:peptidoglycan DD-metalloendopeptidase family protein [Nitrospirota bacterium]NTW65647.1 peptidoglycan DD-metalloendopeptidase family protein [Nitrospirota bacterium]
MKIMPDMRRPLPGALENISGKQDPEAVKKAAREMESLFAYEMIKAMRATTGESAKSGLGNDTYLTMFDLELSKLFAERGLGLQDMFAKGLSAASNKAKSGQLESVSGELKAILPEEGRIGISSDFGPRKDPISGERKFHHGLDIPAPAGTGIHPVKPGTVQFSGEQAGYGNVVVIDHGDGFVSKYAHNQANLVNTGERVSPATAIATVGSTGRSTGPHVHFEVAYQGEKVDPRALLAQAEERRKG